MGAAREYRAVTSGHSRDCRSSSRYRYLYERDPSGKRLPSGATRRIGHQAGAIFDARSISFHWPGLQRGARPLRHPARLRTGPSKDGFHDRRIGDLSAAALECKAPKLNCPIIVSIVSDINSNYAADPEKSLTGGAFANMSLPDHPRSPDETIH